MGDRRSMRVGDWINAAALLLILPAGLVISVIGAQFGLRGLLL